MSLFQRATRKRAKLRLGLSGPSGSGKTWSALLVARGLVGPEGRIALIDTEYGSASTYSQFAFDTLEIRAPYSISKYVQAIGAAAAEGYDCLIIDSLSHAWAGEGGILESVDRRQAQGGNKLVAWADGTKDQNAFTHAILNAPLHIIGTLRAKQEYAIEQGQNGKPTVRKLGMASVQREGFEFDLSTVLSLEMDHYAAVGSSGKDRTGLFVDPRRLSEEDGKRLAAWLDSGAAPMPPTEAEAQRAAQTAVSERRWTSEQVRGALAGRRIADLDVNERAAFVATLSTTPVTSTTTTTPETTA